MVVGGGGGMSLVEFKKEMVIWHALVANNAHVPCRFYEMSMSHVTI